MLDGNRGHWVEEFEGERISRVFFMVGKYWKTKSNVMGELKNLGFEIPTPKSMAHAQSLLLQPRGYGAKQLPKMASFADMFGKTTPKPVVIKRTWEVPKDTMVKKGERQHDVLKLLRRHS